MATETTCACDDDDDDEGNESVAEATRGDDDGRMEGDTVGGNAVAGTEERSGDTSCDSEERGDAEGAGVRTEDREVEVGAAEDPAGVLAPTGADVAAEGKGEGRGRETAEPVLLVVVVAAAAAAEKAQEAEEDGAAADDNAGAEEAAATATAAAEEEDNDAPSENDAGGETRLDDKEDKAEDEEAVAASVGVIARDCGVVSEESETDKGPDGGKSAFGAVRVEEADDFGTEKGDCCPAPSVANTETAVEITKGVAVADVAVIEEEEEEKEEALPTAAWDASSVVCALDSGTPSSACSRKLGVARCFPAKSPVGLEGLVPARTAPLP